MNLYRPKTLSVILSLLLLATATLSMSGCSDDHRRLSEGETLDYKRDLIRQGELSASQVTEFGADTRRTKAEINSLYGKMSAESAEQRAKERAYWENELRRENATGTVEP